VGSVAVLLVDTNIAIEAVRTECWNAITGRRRVVTVEECAAELRRGNPAKGGYVVVTEAQIGRATVNPLEPAVAAEFRLRYPNADGLDAGERDLLALAMSLAEEFEVCCADKAALVAANALGWLGRVVSLEAVAQSVGARPNPGLKRQFTEAQMRAWRTSLNLGGPI
jgi:hypothetical protein